MRIVKTVSGLFLLAALLVGSASVALSMPGQTDADSPISLGERSAPQAYAVLVKQSTYDDPAWRAVVDALCAKYPSRLFIWDASIFTVQDDVAAYDPTHVGFVCELPTATATFVQSYVWPFMRGLDADIYCDAVWGIITGHEAADAMGLVTTPNEVEIKTVLGGTLSCDLTYYTQGISTSEGTYNRYYIKTSDSATSTEYNDGPTDRTEWLVTMINEGVDIFDDDPVDIFYTSGHGAHNMWQMHYPYASLEGYFRSAICYVFGDPYSGANININSTNPKIYFGLGNCQIGKILGSHSMAPAWIRTGGAVQYTGYVINEGSTSHQHGGTKSYFYRVARHNTWAEAYCLANIALRFDMANSTPGASPPDLSGSALYGDPGLQAKMSHEGAYVEPLFTSELSVVSGEERDIATFRITMNREGSPGYTSKWGERHPAILLPFRAEDAEIVSTDAISVVVENNFALMYIWYQGQPTLAEGETREVVFSYITTTTGVDDGPVENPDLARIDLEPNYPNPFNPRTKIAYTLSASGRVHLEIVDLDGRLVATIVDEIQSAGRHEVVWNAGDTASGLYFYRVLANGTSATGKCVLLK